MNKLSATVITLDEEKNIEKCLNSLKGLVDEIIVVDCGSTDKTVELARRKGARVFTREFDNFANQKNWAAEKASGEWIFSIDADEIVPVDLAEAIRAAISSDEFTGYLIPRRNIILGGEIKHSRWSPDKHVWLWRKDKGKWEGVVHEEVVVQGKVGELTEAKIHYQDRTVSEFIQSNIKYAELLAGELAGKEKKFSVLRMFWDAVYEFSLRYFVKKGFLDGWRGFTLSYLMAFYQLIVWVNVWEKEK